MHTDLFSMALADGPDMLPPPPRAPSSEMGDLKLYFTKIDVHRVDHAKDGAKDYIVSNLKTFDVGVLLHNERTQQLAYSVPLGLQVTVMLESGEPVGQPQALAGDTLKAVDSGRCNFRLTINALSEHHGKAIAEAMNQGLLVRVLGTRVVAFGSRLALKQFVGAISCERVRGAVKWGSQPAPLLL